ncbi:hypothetical protein [Shimazuella kribbensis]|uniref:hypothetical protein n=1 Tax=Shimazuella kribbensis TaxID=139808 RepID=UPI00040CD158|nr:hypothetical protein [Shimazuella kribbensis]
MNPILQVIYMSITVLMYYKILQLFLLGLVIKRAVKGDTKRVGITVLSFFIALVFLCGIPSGYVKQKYPKYMPNAEAEIIKEVTTSWNH